VKEYVPALAARGLRTRVLKLALTLESRVPFEHRSLPRVSPDVVWTSVSDGAVLFCVSRELYYGANQVAAFVWQQLAGASSSFEELCDTVIRQFPEADAEEVRTDVFELLDEFERQGLVIAAAAA
jgi:coenzyme PQQ synthesis protein D (PqqD)